LTTRPFDGIAQRRDEPTRRASRYGQPVRERADLYVTVGHDSSFSTGKETEDEILKSTVSKISP
jgi:hypothetical protein